MEDKIEMNGTFGLVFRKKNDQIDIIAISGN